MILFPNAKINLGLHILSKREDNYHNIDTLMYPLDFCDILEFLPSPGTETTLSLSGIPVSGNLSENLVYKAYLLLEKKFHLPQLRIHLHKMIPPGAGLGGGSSDAAHMLKGLNQMFGLALNNIELKDYSSELGSDCSFFIDNVPSFATGKGEILRKALNYLENVKIALLFPGFKVSTAEAYQGITPEPDKRSLISILESGLYNWKKLLKNDFETNIFAKHPVLSEIKSKLYENGAIYASMSGSGSAVYGLFEKNYILPPELQKFLIGRISV